MPTDPDPITTYGLTPVPSSAETLLTSLSQRNQNQPPVHTPLSTLQTPNTPLSKRINDYARAHLPRETYNHSRRVYCYGLMMKKLLAAGQGGNGVEDEGVGDYGSWNFSDETYFLACLLHDIGSTETNMQHTKMSFEFQGGFLALDVLQGRDADGHERRRGDYDDEARAPKDQAESIAEAIIRHQDICEKGRISALGQLVQLATIFDNTGTHAHLIHPSTIEEVCQHFPRLKWSSCFAATIRQEIELKPWAHTTVLGEEEFPRMVLGNRVMEPYE